jgi:hypothetical protein
LADETDLLYKLLFLIAAKRNLSKTGLALQQLKMTVFEKLE